MLAGFIENGIDSDEKIERGMAAARASGSDFLPNAGTFAKWCRHYSNPAHRPFDEPSPQDRKRIRQQRSSPETFTEQIARMRAICEANHES